MSEELYRRLSSVERRQADTEGGLSQVRTEVHQVRATVEELRGSQQALVSQVEARITAHLEKQDDAISATGGKVDELHKSQIARDSREKALEEAAAKAKARRTEILKIIGYVVGAPAALGGLFAALRALGGVLKPLFH